MNITIINDCKDGNAIIRQESKIISLLNCPVSFIGVENDVEASGNIIDILDAFEGREGIVVANISPRAREGKKWGNGSPFGYFWYKKILIVSSIDGFTLSLVKKLELATIINVVDISKTLNEFIKEGIILEDKKNSILNTQFRSYDFIPYLVYFLIKGNKLESEKLPIDKIKDIDKTIWWIDNFGNCKTTILEEEVKKKKKISLNIGELPYFDRLKDVPDNEIAIITGSSGIGKKRFLEIVSQGQSAKKELNLSVNDKIIVLS